VLIHVYFHSDFDGICSAAVFSNVLRQSKSVGDVAFTYIPVDYDVKTHWITKRLEQPCAIVDFLYHPDATWWFDHHETTFARKDWELAYQPDLQHVWRTQYKSCPRLIVDTIPDSSVKRRLRRRFSEILKWCDVIDSANYDSASQVIKMAEPALRINATLSQDRGPDYLKFLVTCIERLSLEAVCELEEVQQRFDRARRWQDAAIAHIRSTAVVKKGVAVINLVDHPDLFHRYAAYYLWQELRFQVAIYRHGRFYKLTVSANPWLSHEGPDLGAICESYGGGGHADVAGIILKSKQRALRAGEEISSILRDECRFHHQLSFRHLGSGPKS